MPVTIDGYIESYYQLNVAAPSNHVTNLRGFDDRDRSITLSNVALGAKAERGPLTARIAIQFGATPTTYYSAEPGGRDIWKYIQQATFAYRARSLTVDAGLLVSPIGPEVIPIKDNWNWSRSNLFFGLPFYHTGARAAYDLGGGWTAMLHVYNGWNSLVDNNSYPSVAMSATYASDDVNGQILYFGGIERPTDAPEGQPWRHLADAYATVAVTGDTSVMAQVDGGIEANTFGNSGWLAGALAVKLQLSSTLYAAARADYFREYVAVGAASIFWPTPWVAEATATVAWQPTDGLSVRLEGRHDHAKDRVYFGGEVAGGAPNRRAQNTLTLGAVAWF